MIHRVKRRWIDWELVWSIAFLAVIAYGVLAYIVNFVKLIADIAGSNFSSSATIHWGQIIIHAIGVVTVLGAPVTVWF